MHVAESAREERSGLPRRTHGGRGRQAQPPPTRPNDRPERG